MVKEPILMNKNNVLSVKNLNIYITILFICAVLSSQSYADGLCSGNNATLECLSKNFEKLYSANYSLFWDILHKAEKKAQHCNPVSDTVQLMELTHLKSINAEFNEFLTEKIEVMCVKHDKCFFKALIRLKEGDQLEIIRRMKNPLFAEQAAISDSFSRNKNNKKYRKIVDLYFANK
jgi:hypothetical protein